VSEAIHAWRDVIAPTPTDTDSVEVAARKRAARARLERKEDP
jgi:hypothetical protein